MFCRDWCSDINIVLMEKSLNKCFVMIDCTTSFRSKTFISYDVVKIWSVCGLQIYRYERCIRYWFCISSVCGLKISKDMKDVLDIGSAHQVFVVFRSTYIKDVLDIGSAYQVFVVFISTYYI